MNVYSTISTIGLYVLMAWWRHKCATSNVTKGYFTELNTNIGQLHSTVYSEKKSTFGLVITLAFLGRFLYFLHYGKETNTLQRSSQNLQHHLNFIFALSSTKTAHSETTVSDHFDLQCIRLNRLFATFAESRQIFIFFIFIGNFYQSSQKIFHILIGFWSRFLSSNSIY